MREKEREAGEAVWRAARERRECVDEEPCARARRVDVTRAADVSTWVTLELRAPRGPIHTRARTRKFLNKLSYKCNALLGVDHLKIPLEPLGAGYVCVRVKLGGKKMNPTSKKERRNKENEQIVGLGWICCFVFFHLRGSHLKELRFAKQRWFTVKGKNKEFSQKGTSR